MIGARFAAMLAAALTAVVSFAVAAVSADHDGRTVGYGQVKFRGLGPERWAQRYRREHARFIALTRQLEAMDARTAIRLVFGPYASSALSVAWCESRLDPAASNGQYLGLFQLGSHERELYGYGASPIAQTIGAYVYFVVSGRSWRPWTCRP